jgi:hypothetical protein
MSKKNPFSLIKFILLSFLLSSCATPVLRKTSQKMRREILQGKFKKALKIVQTEPSYKEKKSQLLYNMEQGLLYHLMGHYKQSLVHLGKAKKIHQKLYTIALKNKLQTLVTNETFDLFYGEVFERSLLHFYLALNHISLYQKGHIIIPVAEGKKSLIKNLSEREKRTHLLSARAEVIAWDSFLDSQQISRRGKSVFKNDLLAKTFGAFIHETINTPSELQIALQLYKDAKILLFRNYNSYKTFNNSSKKFKLNFEKLPKWRKDKIKREFISQTPYSEELKTFLNFKILELTKKIRPYEMKKMIRVHNIGEKTVNRVQKTPRPTNVAFIIQRGLIPAKVASKQHYSLESALTPDNPSKTQREIAAVGSFVLLAYAANELGLFPPAHRYDPVGAEIGVRFTQYSTQGLAISFELPKIKNNKIKEHLSLEVYNENKELAWKGPLSIVAPLGDIAEEAIAEYSAALYPKLGARLALKHLGAIFASYMTYKHMSKDGGANYLAKLAAVGQYMAVSAAIEASETADTRYWSSLPSNIRMANAYLKKGTYQIKMIISKKDNNNPQKRIIPLGSLTIKDEKKKQIFNYRR